MKKLLLPFLFMLLSFSTFSQVDSFDISTYTLPETKLRSLELMFDLSGEARERDNSDYQDFSGNLDLGYRSFINRMDLQRSSLINLRLYAAGSQSTLVPFTNEGQHESENYHYAPFLGYHLVNRKYYPGKLFWELDPSLNLSHRKSSYSKDIGDTIIQRADYVNTDITAALPVKFGKGRIERIDDARQAVYIMEALTEQNRLSSGITQEEINEFAELISVLKQKRFFDYRIRRMYELEALDSFLVANNLVVEQDSRYFTILSDLWDYADGPVRYSGSRFSVSINPGYLYEHSKSTLISGNDTDSKSKILFLFAGLEFNHEKPLNLNWQHIIDLYGYVGGIKLFDDEDNVVNSGDARTPNLILAHNQSIAYYPNTRTEMSLGYMLTYNMYFKDPWIFQGGESKGISTNLRYNMNYYISPRVRLNVRTSLNRTWLDPYSSMNGPSFLPDNNFYTLIYSGRLYDSWNLTANISFIYKIF